MDDFWQLGFFNDSFYADLSNDFKLFLSCFSFDWALVGDFYFSWAFELFDVFVLYFTGSFLKVSFSGFGFSAFRFFLQGFVQRELSLGQSTEPGILRLGDRGLGPAALLDETSESLATGVSGHL